MSEDAIKQAKLEIDSTMTLCNFCMRRFGLSFETPKTRSLYFYQKILFIISICGIIYHVFSEAVYIGVALANSPRVEDVVPLFHTFGYGALSFAKVFALWYKKNVLGQLLYELTGIWPMGNIDGEASEIKVKSLAALQIVHKWYFAVNLAGVWFYNVTPIFIYLFKIWQGNDAQFGFVWKSWYPFDKNQPFAHAIVYLFEVFAGQTCVWIMICTDLLFSAMASHITLLLRLLQRRLKTLGTDQKTHEQYLQEIIENIKLHQRLIRYCNDLEEAFSLVNLVNIVFSSVNICCVMFVIVLLESFLDVSNKLFLASALIQIGMICWYADEILHANANVALAAYNSGWYRTSPRSRRTLIFLIRRGKEQDSETNEIETAGNSLAQKPIAFTAMKFTNISLITYSSILTRSYSYFALLYTMYSDSIQTHMYKRTSDDNSQQTKNFVSTEPPSRDRLETSDEDSNGFKHKHIIHLPTLRKEEMEFLKLAAADNVDDVQKYLKDHPGINVNCKNYQGISALHIAVQNRSAAMVAFLLKQPNIEIGDTVLHAVRDNSIKILVMLLETQKKICPGLEFAGATHSTDFPEHVTPLILAAQCGHYEAVAVLVARGHDVARPHSPSCCCIDCKRSLAHDDALHASSSRLSVYRAISSPAYLVHVSSDPILDAFRLSVELAANAAAYRQLADVYLQLRDDVSVFAVELIGCCRTSEEVELILKQTSGSSGRRHFVLPRLLMAMDYKQKEFVAHPNTQQVLELYWLGDWNSWRRKSSVTKAFIVLSRIFIIPLILFICTIAPWHKLVRHWQIPLNKMITHATAYVVFLALVFCVSNQDKTAQKRGPPNTGAEAPLILYVCGYTWSAVRMCVMQGPRRYFTVMWNWCEVIMLVLFALTFVLWIAAAVDVANSSEDNIDRKYWDQYDPTLLAEGTFCLATIFAYFRLMFLCQLNYHLGPLQVSLGKMTIDIYKYIIVFSIIISAFAAGLTHFYQYYDGMVYEDEFGMKTVQVSSFTSLRDTLNTLFWALFCMAPLESADVVLENTRDTDRSHENRHSYTERIGYFCFGSFEVVSVIIVLNMLIATMSNTFQRVNDNVAIEWTFGKTEVYLDYMLQTTLPSPFNMIPTATGMSDVIDWIRIKLGRSPGAHARWSLAYCCYIERDLESNARRDFPALMSVLVQRYFRDKEPALADAAGEKGEIELLRRELSSLRKFVQKQAKLRLPRCSN